MNSVTTLVDFALADHQLPATARADAERLLADTLAVGAAGSKSSEAAKVFEHVGRGGTGSAARLFTGDRTPEVSAAFFNGFSIHCLEWDAVHEPAVVHALSVVTAALLAASDRRGGSDPDAFLTALAIGVDIASGLGIAATGPMRFFRPATAGIIGATLAVGRLDGLTPNEMTDAVGIAYSFTGGTMQAHVEGSVALPLQIARAAQGAVQAVDLAKSGLSGPHDVIDGPFGYGKLIEPLDLTAYLADLGEKWRISDVSIKPFASGRASHAILAALDEIHDSGRTITAITANVPPLIHRLVARPYLTGMTPAYARLCLPFLCALMLRTGRIDPRCFTPETFADPIIRDIAAKVRIQIDDNPDTNALGPQKLVVNYTDDTLHYGNIEHTLGSPAAPMNAAQADAKYELCRVLAGDCDPRIFDDPLSYATDPR